jgi:Asp-tRNA(Asn)/Glu-tRNA(Gln) amidotransferase A subunit family amidase
MKPESGRIFATACCFAMLGRMHHYLGLLEISGRIRRRELTSEELTQRLLERIARLDQTLHSFITVLPDAALAEARRADREIAAGNWRGPLHGVPLGVKDLLCMEGIPTTAGMPLLANYRPAEDAEVIKRLRRAGLSAAGVPTLSLPCGFSAGEVPLGVQLAARRLGESSLFRAGAAFQQAADFHLRRPPL